MAEWERREKRLVELALASGADGALVHRALYAAESEWRESRGLRPDGPIPAGAVTVHVVGMAQYLDADLVVRYEVLDVEVPGSEPVVEQPVEEPDTDEGEGRGDVQP